MSALEFRLARPEDLPHIRKLIIDSFEPITWYKKLDETIGPLNGCDWHERWEQRMDKVFASEIVLAGIAEGEVAAASTGIYTPRTALGFINLLGVDRRHQGKGYGRAMLHGMVDHFRGIGAKYCHLDCLTDNAKANALYAAEGWQIVSTSHHYFIRLDA